MNTSPYPDSIIPPTEHTTVVVNPEQPSLPDPDVRSGCYRNYSVTACQLLKWMGVGATLGTALCAPSFAARANAKGIAGSAASGAAGGAAGGAVGFGFFIPAFVIISKFVSKFPSKNATN